MEVKKETMGMASLSPELIMRESDEDVIRALGLLDLFTT